MAGTVPDRTIRLADGHDIPLLGFGTYQLHGDEARRAILSAVEAGYRQFDTATSYANEADVGAAIAAAPVPRGELFVTTKLPPGLAGHELDTLRDSLRQLRTDHVDLWLVHHPEEGELTRTWEAFIAARDAGLARSIGVSNYSAGQIDRLERDTGVRPCVNQIRWNPFLFDRAVLDAHRARAVAIQGYTPLRRARLDDQVLAGIAARHDRTPAQVIVRWHVQHAVIVLPRSARPERIRDNADVGGFELSTAEMAALDALGGTWRD